MEPLLEQLKSLPARWNGFGRGTRLAIIGTILGLASVGTAAYFVSGGADTYQYAFTNLSAEDGQAASAVLKSSGIPFRSEAGGTALAVPANKVYDARLILAAQGLPRAGGIGFEIFDKGQFGVSEFTQKVNLRRAIEGELARTVGSLAEVRSARVHLTLSERGLYRDEDKKATASVVVTLHPGRALSKEQLSGVRHLIASAVPGLLPESVTVVDGRGSVLGGSSENGAGSGFEGEKEAELQTRVVSMLEPVVGAGAVVARISVTADNSEVSQNAEVFDPDQVALKTEKTGSSNSQTENGQQNGGIAGATANQPMVLQNPGGTSNKSSTTSGDAMKSYEVSKTQTTTIIRSPRVRKLSVAILLEQPKAGPRDEAEVARLGELAKKAVGFDEARGDQFQISQATFTHADAVEGPVVPEPQKMPWWFPYAAAGGVLLLMMIVGFIATRGGKKDKVAPMVLKPGMKVSELEAQNAVATALANGKTPGALIDAATGAVALGGSAAANAANAAAKGAKSVDVVPPALPADVALRDKAVAHAKKDPVKTAQLIRAWIAADAEAAKEARRG